jgi:RHS repeat-associated protein
MSARIMSSIRVFSSHTTAVVRSSAVHFVALLVLFFAPLSVQGDQPAMTARGFDSQGMYQFGDIDSVNTMNGNLIVSIPIGPKYTVGDTLSYQFMLVYNSSFWEFEIPGGAGLPSDPSRFRDDADWAEAVPDRSANAGVGWRLSVGGEMINNNTYVGIDGSRHEFKDVLHWENAPPVVVGVFYSRDGSYLRKTGTFVKPVIEFPDGRKHTFECVVANCQNKNAAEQRYVLREITDAYGNRLEVQSSAADSVFTFIEHRATNSSTVKRAEGVQQVLTLRAYPHAPYSFIVDTLDLAGPNGSRAKWKFEYKDEPTPLGAKPENVPFGPDEAALYRDLNHRTTKALTLVQKDNDPMRVPLLEEVRLASTVGGTAADPGKWRFEYHNGLPLTDPFPPPNVTRPYFTSADSGKLTRIILPTKGAIDYTYGRLVFPLEVCGTQGPQSLAFRTTGVRTRQWLNANLQPEGAPWEYKSQAGPIHESGTGDQRCKWVESFETTILDPLKGATVNYFQISPGKSPNAGRTAISTSVFYGLPMSPDHRDPATNALPGDQQRFLSTQVYDCPSTFTLEGGSVSVSCALERETFVRYQHSAPRNCISGSECTESNRRLAETITFYRDDNNRWRRTQYEDFDGLGHYRRTIESGNFFAGNFSDTTARGERRTTHTHYNRGVTFTEATSIGDVGTLTGVSSAMPWVLGTYDVMWSAEDNVREGLSERVEEAQFDPQTGRLIRKRLLAAGVHTADNRASGRAARDLLTVYDRTVSSEGSVTLTEKNYGGDMTSLPSGQFANELGAVDLSAADPEYFLRTTLDMAVSGSAFPSTVEYVDCNESSFLKLETASIDRATGVAHSSSSTSGRGTTYAYDPLGRVVSIAAAGDTAVTVAYPSLSGSAPPYQVTLTQDSLVESGHRYDHRGRAAGSGSKVPELNGARTALGSPVWRWSEIVYWPNGWKRAETTQGVAISEGATTYKDYDPLGRPQTIVHPDAVNSDRKTTISYTGDRLIQRTVGGVTASEHYDSLGRLVKVAQGNIAATRYDYDASNNIVLVTASNQERRFRYDGRGFLRMETPPELATKTIQYRYDSRGNLGEKVLGKPEIASGSLGSRGEFDLSYTYDAAERLVSVTAPSGTGRTIKSFMYYGNTDADRTSRKAGMLQRATRTNRVPRPLRIGANIELPVSTDFEYDPTDGRLKKTAVTVRGQGGLAFQTTLGYDNAGSLTSIVYPANAVAPSRNVSMTYTQGRLTGIIGFASEISYVPSGIVDEVRRNNGMRDRYFPEDRNLPRYKRINYQHATQPSLSFIAPGEYAYDPRGNITTIGKENYGYDDASRLKTASLPGLIQTFQYDVHGNILSISGAGNVTIGVSNSTNRMTSIGSATSTPAYDDAGNLIALPDLPNTESPARPPLRYTYDPLNMMVSSTGKDVARVFVYDASDERVGVLDFAFPQNGDGDLTNDLVRETWSLRGPGNTVLRDVIAEVRGNVTSSNDYPSPASWTWSRDYVYRGSTILASVGPNGAGQQTRHLHTDHLGTVRAVTDGNGVGIDTRRYLPFGGEVAPSSSVERHKFTGHERDDNGSDRPWGDLDYMHARYYAPFVGRFLSLDPAAGKPALPQSWNRYVYVRNNPIGFTDPDGRADVDFSKTDQYGPVGGMVRLMIDSPVAHIEKAVVYGVATVAAGTGSVIADVLVSPFRLSDEVERGISRETRGRGGWFPITRFTTSYLGKKAGHEVRRAVEQILYVPVTIVKYVVKESCEAQEKSRKKLEEAKKSKDK